MPKIKRHVGIKRSIHNVRIPAGPVSTRIVPTRTKKLYRILATRTKETRTEKLVQNRNAKFVPNDKILPSGWLSYMIGPNARL